MENVLCVQTTHGLRGNKNKYEQINHTIYLVREEQDMLTVMLQQPDLNWTFFF